MLRAGPAQGLQRSTGVAYNQAGQGFLCDWQSGTRNMWCLFLRVGMFIGIIRTWNPAGELEWYAGIQQDTATAADQGSLSTRFAVKTGFDDSTITEAKFNLVYGVALPPSRYSDYVWPLIDPSLTDGDEPPPPEVNWMNRPASNTTVRVPGKQQTFSLQTNVVAGIVSSRYKQQSHSPNHSRSLS